MSLLYRAAMFVGSWWCHQLPERSPHLFGAQLPLCWRCAGIVLGALALLCWLFVKKKLPPLWLSLPLASALPLDVLANALTGGGMLDNPRRFLTGVLWGVCATGVALHLLKRVAGRQSRPSPAETISNLKFQI